jgi:hypothetical protein
MRCGGIPRAISVATVLLIGSTILPRVAEAQARGTLQATATVVDTRTSFAALDVARIALQSAVSHQPVLTATATVAQVSVSRSEDRAAAILVTISYSRN